MQTEKEIWAITYMYMVTSNFQSTLKALMLHLTLKEQSGNRCSDHYLREKKTAFPRRRSDLAKVTKLGSNRIGSRNRICLLDADQVFPHFSNSLDSLFFYSANSQAFGVPGMIVWSAQSCTCHTSRFSPGLERSVASTVTLCKSFYLTATLCYVMLCYVMSCPG